MDLDSRTQEQVQLLADSRNRTIMAIINDADEPLHVEEVAECLVSRDVTVVNSTTYENKLENTLLSLHHNRLPKLAEAELLDYDPEANIAMASPSEEPDVEWQGEDFIAPLVSHLQASVSDEERLGVISGRDSAIQYGRQLADEAEEELFCMYVNADLLGDECVRRAEDAIDRGVTVYLGSQSAEVRDLARKHLPEATLWEPQLDWLNAPTYPRVGRLVLMDRRKVMLALLEEPSSEGTYPDETALVGDGEDNPLVTLVRELLGPRIDHLDYQSQRFRTEINP